MKRKSLKSRLGSEWLFFDGGTGSLLQKKGLMPGELPETWNRTRPDAIREIAESYFRAGSDIVNANTFGANRLKYPKDLKRIVTSGVKLAQEGRKRAGRTDGYVALDLGPTGRLLKPMGDLPFEEAVSLYREVVRIGSEAGADLVMIETMSDTYEVKAAVLGAKEACDLPVLVSMTFDESGKLLTGGDVAAVVALLEGLHVDGIGMNCGMGPKQMIPIVKEFLKYSSLPILVNPNAGLPRVTGEGTVYDITPDVFARAVKTIAKLGVHAVGGCCGTTPEHIQKVVRLCRDLPFSPPVKKERTLVSSYSKAVEIGRVPVVIGERINPTGKSDLKEALRRGDLDHPVKRGIEQEEAGAHLLDVNVGLPEIDEKEVLTRLIGRLQSVTALPLTIDTSDPAALEAALRTYNGKPMINSVNGTKESLQSVLPLVRKYGGVLIVLPLNETGIPKTAKGRLRIAKQIFKQAERYGIPRCDLIVDGLTMTVSSDPASGNETLKTLRLVREELGAGTVLGVSNVSFGLPAREQLNAAFLALALGEGLSCAIMNPNAGTMMRVFTSYKALTDRDPLFAEYLERYGKDQEKKETASLGNTKLSLSESVERGLVKDAEAAAKEERKVKDPLSIVNEELIPSLDRVGRGFEKGTVFLPQLLLAAEAAQAAFSVIKKDLKGKAEEKKGTVLLATVKNDIHDIGKNIVKVLLENYGFDVLDLGKDVSAEEIVKATVRGKIRLVGLSALMTTTVSGMEETIRLLKKKSPKTKVIVGGAVMTPEYAEKIGADAYGRDAMDTVRYADRLFQERE